MQFKSTRETVWGWLGKKWALERLHFTESKHTRARVQDNAFLLLLAILIFKKLILSLSINLSSKFSLNQFLC